MLATAFAAAEEAGVRGKAVTPFLLGFIVDASGGRSLEVNLDLARNNVRVAADIATAWSALRPSSMTPGAARPAAHRRAFGDIVNDIVVVPRGTSPARHRHDRRRSARGPAARRRTPRRGSARSARPVDFVGCVGIADLDYHVQRLRAQGVVPHLTTAPGLPTGTIVILVEGEHRTMLTERGANAALRAPTVTDSAARQAAVLHLTGYTLVDGSRARARELIDRARAAGVLVSLNPGSAGYIADFGAAEVPRRRSRARTLLFPNLAEGRALTGEPDPDRVAAALLEQFPVVVADAGRGRGAGGRARAQPGSGRGSDRAHRGSDGRGRCVHRRVPRELGSRPATRWPPTEAGVFVAARAVMVIGGRPPI